MQTESQSLNTESPGPEADAPMRRDRPALIALVLANAVPLVGVLFFGWDLANVMVLFWAESAVIGVYNVAKMLTMGGLRAIPLALFFTVHYGMFMLVHLVFVLVLTQPGGIFESGPDDGPFALLPDLLTVSFAVAIAALFVSHGISFVVHFLIGAERPKKLNELMGAPYGRIVVMHITIILGAALTLVLGSNVVLLVLLVILKLAADIWAHRRSHRKAALR